MLGFNIPGLAVLGVALLALIGVVVRQFVPYRRQAHEAEAKLREDLIRRVERLETKLERQQVRHEAEKRLLTHKHRNMTANFDSMLMMLETSPDKVPEIVAAIKKQRASQMIAEAKEAAIISAIEMEIEAALEREADMGMVVTK
jgi:hypothetical protein